LYPSAKCPSCTPYNIQTVIQDYTGGGIPASKLVLGMPLYGRAFSNTTGVGQAFNGVGEGSWENGIWDYKVLPRPGATEHIDEESGASYSYDANSQTLVSYDTVEMALRKVHYIQQNGLGGAMWWELSGDKEGAGSIITNVSFPSIYPSTHHIHPAPTFEPTLPYPTLLCTLSLFPHSQADVQ
jgi:chitinase